VDDSLTIPELVLDETAMSVMHDGNLYAYEDDKVLTVGEDGEIVGMGHNLLVNPKQYVDGRGDTIIIRGNRQRLAEVDYIWGYIFDVHLIKGKTYTFSVPVYNSNKDDSSIARISGFLGNNLKRVEPLEFTIFRVTGTADIDYTGKIY